MRLQQIKLGREQQIIKFEIGSKNMITPPRKFVGWFALNPRLAEKSRVCHGAL
jgi:hypothetical protein